LRQKAALAAKSLDSQVSMARQPGEILRNPIATDGDAHTYEAATLAKTPPESNLRVAGVPTRAARVELNRRAAEERPVRALDRADGFVTNRRHR
jgi:hypothetical protein